MIWRVASSHFLSGVSHGIVVTILLVQLAHKCVMSFRGRHFLCQLTISHRDESVNWGLKVNLLLIRNSCEVKISRYSTSVWLPLEWSPIMELLPRGCCHTNMVSLNYACSRVAVSHWRNQQSLTALKIAMSVLSFSQQDAVGYNGSRLPYLLPQRGISLPQNRPYL